MFIKNGVNKGKPVRSVPTVFGSGKPILPQSTIPQSSPLPPILFTAGSDAVTAQCVSIMKEEILKNTAHKGNCLAAVNILETYSDKILADNPHALGQIRSKLELTAIFNELSFRLGSYVASAKQMRNLNPEWVKSINRFEDSAVELAAKRDQLGRMEFLKELVTLMSGTVLHISQLDTMRINPTDLIVKPAMFAVVDTDSHLASPEDNTNMNTEVFLFMLRNIPDAQALLSRATRHEAAVIRNNTQLVYTNADEVTFTTETTRNLLQTFCFLNKLGWGCPTQEAVALPALRGLELEHSDRHTISTRHAERMADTAQENRLVKGNDQLMIEARRLIPQMKQVFEDIQRLQSAPPTVKASMKAYTVQIFEGAYRYTMYNVKQLTQKENYIEDDEEQGQVLAFFGDKLSFKCLTTLTPDYVKIVHDFIGDLPVYNYYLKDEGMDKGMKDFLETSVHVSIDAAKSYVGAVKFDFQPTVAAIASWIPSLKGADSRACVHGAVDAVRTYLNKGPVNDRWVKQEIARYLQENYLDLHIAAHGTPMYADDMQRSYIEQSLSPSEGHFQPLIALPQTSGGADKVYQYLIGPV